VEASVWKLYAQKEDSLILFVFENTCLSAPRFSKLSEKGFTTKKCGSGLGLYVVSETLQRNKNLSLNTQWENGYFIQEFRVLIK